MMTLWNSNVFHIIGESRSTVTYGIPLQRGSSADLWCLLCWEPEYNLLKKPSQVASDLRRHDANVTTLLCHAILYYDPDCIKYTEYEILQNTINNSEWVSD